LSPSCTKLAFVYFLQSIFTTPVASHYICIVYTFYHNHRVYYASITKHNTVLHYYRDEACLFHDCDR